MKGSTLLTTLVLAAGALAEYHNEEFFPTRSINKRQVQQIVDVVNGINDKTGDLDTAIKGYNGGDPSKILDASDAVNSAVSDGVDTIKGLDTVSQTDALQIQPAVQTLTETLNQTVDDLIAKKDAITSAGQCSVTSDQLVSQSKGAQSLSDAITSKVPESLQSLASSLSQGISDALQRAVFAYSDCPAGGSSSAGGGGSSSAAPSESASASSAPASASASASGGGASSAPAATPTGSAPSAVSSSPPQFTGGASSNLGSGCYGLLAQALVAAACAM